MTRFGQRIRGAEARQLQHFGQKSQGAESPALQTEPPGRPDRFGETLRRLRRSSRDVGEPHATTADKPLIFHSMRLSRLVERRNFSERLPVRNLSLAIRFSSLRNTGCIAFYLGSKPRKSVTSP